MPAKKQTGHSAAPAPVSITIRAWLRPEIASRPRHTAWKSPVVCIGYSSARKSAPPEEKSIPGDPTQTVSQEDLQKAWDARLCLWTIGKRAAILSERIIAALDHGASIEDGPLSFDRELECVAVKGERGF